MSDTGRGISPEDLPRLFEKFYRGNNRGASPPAQPGATGAGARTMADEAAATATEPETPGVGLGLYLAQAIVGQLGGQLGVESTPGAGSTFTVSLPAWEPDANVSTSGDSPAHSSGTEQGEAHEEAFVSG